jgi:sulfotransferase family protein
LSAVPADARQHRKKDTPINPIFIIGTERSGTNLLRLILNAHPHIAVPHPPHIVKFFGPLAPRYGDLHDDRNFRRLVADVCRMVELHPYPWEIVPDRERVVREARDRNLISIYFALYDQYLAASGKKRWACKSTFMIDHVAEILRYHPQARFIYMVRDGRDVAVSAKASIFNHFHPYYSALRWQREQETGLAWLAKLPPEQIMLLKYEELTADPQGVTERLCAFLDEPFDGRMLDYYRQPEARKSGSLSLSWQNTARPVLKDNTEKFRNELTPSEILLVEAICYRELQALGYRLTFSVPELASCRAEMLRPRPAYRATEILLKLKAEARHLARDRNSGMRLKKILFLRYLGLARRGEAPGA